MNLKVLSIEDCEQARQWRNINLSMNRTPYHLTKEQQSFFYQDVICNRKANSRYWGIWEEVNFQCNLVNNGEPIALENFIGMGEITNISLENRNGEIGLIMHPDYNSMAEQAIDLILKQGFGYLNLENIFGEVYLCSSYIEIWRKIADKYEAMKTSLPNRKYWNGEYYNSLYFNISKGEFLRLR